jgi:DNA helicase-4
MCGSDSLLQMVLPRLERYPHAEERRLFYVALTRARSAVWLVADLGAPSEFVAEVEAYGGALVKIQHDGDGRAIRCPACRAGSLIQRKEKDGPTEPDDRLAPAERERPEPENSDYFCSYWWHCDSWTPTCPACGKVSVGWHAVSNSHRCADFQCQSGRLDCPECGKPVSRRPKRDGSFYVACADYGDGCRYSIDMEAYQTARQGEGVMPRRTKGARDRRR